MLSWRAPRTAKMTSELRSDGKLKHAPPLHKATQRVPPYATFSRRERTAMASIMARRASAKAWASGVGVFR